MKLENKRVLVVGGGSGIGYASEAAEAYSYLLRGSYTTGHVLYVEGGAALVGRPG